MKADFDLDDLFRLQSAYQIRLHGLVETLERLSVAAADFADRTSGDPSYLMGRSSAFAEAAGALRLVLQETHG